MSPIIIILFIIYLGGSRSRRMISKIENKKVLLVLLAKGDGLQHKFNIMEQYEDDK